MLSSAQTDAEVSWADSVLRAGKDDMVTDLNTRSDNMDAAALIFRSAGMKCKECHARIAQAVKLAAIGIPDSALSNLIWAEEHLPQNCESSIKLSLFANYSYVYLNLNEFERTDSLCQTVLETEEFREEDSEQYLALLNNWATSLGTQDLLLESEKKFRLLLQESERLESPAYKQKALINLGVIRAMSGDLDSAYFYFDATGKVAAAIQDKENLIAVLTNLAEVEKFRENFSESKTLLDSASSVAESMESKELMLSVIRGKSSLSEYQENWKETVALLQEYQALKDEYLDEKRIKAVTEMTEKYESEKQARQIQELEVANLDAELQNEKVTKSRNRLVFGGIALVILAAGLWSRLTYVRRSRAAIQKEKDVSEGLLLNILPSKVADELKEKGYADAQLYDVATILFSDFKGFTAISEQLTPSELVSEIDICFKAFDEIMTSYGIEKIKTIGDAYMAAGGLPSKDSGSPEDVILAALDMQAFMAERYKAQTAAGKPAFQMRVGINSGSVIAGIVGVKKFQYDIWGDTVNTAARMESSGETDQVNISETTYELVKTSSKLKFSERGLIEAKGKGKLKMYFAERA